MNPEASQAHSPTESCLRAVPLGLDRSDTFPFQRPLDHGHRRLDRRFPPGGFSGLNWAVAKSLPSAIIEVGIEMVWRTDDQR